jgi:hypothetical protein
MGNFNKLHTITSIVNIMNKTLTYVNNINAFNFLKSHFIFIDVVLKAASIFM